jgi:hypothetical protein
MVGGKLRLVTAAVRYKWSGHDAGTVDQEMQEPASCEEPGGEGIDRCAVEQGHRLDGFLSRSLVRR